MEAKTVNVKFLKGKRAGQVHERTKSAAAILVAAKVAVITKEKADEGEGEGDSGGDEGGEKEKKGKGRTKDKK